MLAGGVTSGLGIFIIVATDENYQFKNLDLISDKYQLLGFNNIEQGGRECGKKRNLWEKNLYKEVDIGGNEMKRPI